MPAPSSANLQPAREPTDYSLDMFVDCHIFTSQFGNVGGGSIFADYNPYYKYSYEKNYEGFDGIRSWSPVEFYDFILLKG